MNKEKVFKYFIYLACIGAFMTISSFLSLKAMIYQKEYINPFPFMLIEAFIYFMFGVLLGFDNFIKQKDKKGNWKIDKIKLLILGLPFIYFSIYPIIYYSKFRWLYGLFKLWIMPILTTKYLYKFSQILLGFTIISSFYKSEK